MPNYSLFIEFIKKMGRLQGKRKYRFCFYHSYQNLILRYQIKLVEKSLVWCDKIEIRDIDKGSMIQAMS